jgi:hypothetical protein
MLYNYQSKVIIFKNKQVRNKREQQWTLFTAIPWNSDIISRNI